MEKSKRIKLESKGWKFGDVDEFLGLDKAEMAIVEMKVALAKAIVNKRKKSKITQVQMAKTIGSSQSRVAKIEHADPAVSIELMLKSLFSMGTTKKEIAKAIQ
jgi:DNA-binding XRE family transcriptional regulator